MIRLRLYNFQYIEIQTEEKIKKRINRYFEKYAKGYFFAPKYRSGQWNGKINFYNKDKSILPYGLFFEFLRFHKENIPEYTLNVDENIKKKFIEYDFDKFNIEYDLKLYPYDYQIKSIEAALKYKTGILRLSVGAGKSLIISYLNKILFDNNRITKSIIVVPTQLLVEQFYKQLHEYGIQYSVGRFYSKKKELDTQIVISTWQSLKNRMNMLKDFDAIFIDETHGAKCKSIKSILQSSPHMKYKYGLTGTLPEDASELYMVKSFLGPVVIEYTTDQLAQKGHLSNCNVEVIKLKYDNINQITHDMVQDEYGFTIEQKVEFPELKDRICIHPFRLDILEDIIKKVNEENILILVSRIEKEGVIIEHFLKKCFKDKQIFFLSGKDPIKLRKEWVEKCSIDKNVILMATYQIFQMGIDIPSLKNIVLYSPYRSKVVVLQSIGRGLRKHKDKIDGANIYDIVDEIEVFRGQYNSRKKLYLKENFNVTETKIAERDFKKILTF